MRKNSRDKILDTARALFPRFGYNGISIRAIAAKARLTTGAVYFHFKNKKDIYKEICLEAIDLLIKKFNDGISSKSTPSQKLISTFDSYLEFYTRHRDHYNILMEAKADYANKSDDFAEIVNRFADLLKVNASPVELGIAQGSFRDIDPRMLSVFLASVTEGMLQYKRMGVLDVMGISDSDFRKFMADVVGSGILIPEK